MSRPCPPARPPGGPAQHARSGPARRRARLHALLARRAPQHRGHRQLGARVDDRPRRPARRRGSASAPGGVMLPNHAPLKVAETFRVLEALHPGRIDLGLGRAPGTDQLTAFALRRSREALAADDFPEQLAELLGFFSGDASRAEHPFQRITPCRDGVAAPPSVAARLERLQRPGRGRRWPGLRLRPPHQPGVRASSAQRPTARVPPVRLLAEPHGDPRRSVVCAETDDEAERARGLARPHLAAAREGPRAGCSPAPRRGPAYPYTQAERARMRADREPPLRRLAVSACASGSRRWPGPGRWTS